MAMDQPDCLILCKYIINIYIYKPVAILLLGVIICLEY